MPDSTKCGPLKLFDDAYAVVTEDRRHLYGEPEDTYRRISAFREIVDECPDVQVREILGMIVTKVARLVQTPTHLDSWVDVADYARCGAMLLDDRANSARSARSANGEPGED